MHITSNILNIIFQLLTSLPGDVNMIFALLTSFLSLLYSKTCVKRPLSKRPQFGFQDGLLLNACQKYCRMLQGSILQYFPPSLSNHLSLRSLFCLFLSGPFTQVLLLLCLKSKAGINLKHVTLINSAVTPTNQSNAQLLVEY